MRRLAVLLVALPLSAGGTLLAHSLSYRLVLPHDHAQALARTGHGYLEHVPLALAVLAALLLLGLADLGRCSLRGPAAPLAAWPYALLPPLFFTVQEHAERLAHTGAFPWLAATEPTFVGGLAIQLPLAVLAYAVARLLVAGAARLAAVLARPPRPPAARRAPLAPRPLAVTVLRPAVLAAGAAGRAPPRSA